MQFALIEYLLKKVILIKYHLKESLNFQQSGRKKGTMEDRKYPIFMDARFGLVYKEGANHMSGKISLEWADIIYDMSKARHL